MANTFSEFQAVRQISTQHLKPGQMAIQDDGGLNYRFYRTMQGKLLLLTPQGHIDNNQTLYVTVTPLPAGSTITITSEV